jgi:hypothetical protein
LWPPEKHLMTAQIAPKPSQHQQDQIWALQHLWLDSLECHHQLQASIESEAKEIYNLLRHMKEPDLLHCDTKAHPQWEPEKKAAEVRGTE